MPAAPIVVAAVIAIAAITTQIGIFLTHRCEFDCLGYGYLREGHRGKQILLSPADVDAIEADFDILTRPNSTLAEAMGRDYGDQSKGFDVDPVPVKRGQVTMHDEWIVHGSGGNAKATPRKTYVVAYRDAKMVEYERSIGFSHSYNDDPDVLRKVRAGEL